MCFLAIFWPGCYTVAKDEMMQTITRSARTSYIAHVSGFQSRYVVSIIYDHSDCHVSHDMLSQRNKHSLEVCQTLLLATGWGLGMRLERHRHSSIQVHVHYFPEWPFLDICYNTEAQHRHDPLIPCYNRYISRNG